MPEQATSALLSSFQQPTPLDDAMVVFPTNVRDLMPPHNEELRAWERTDEGRKWLRVQADWFFSGLANVKSYPKPGVDPATAWRHLKACQGSWEPKHEHKMAGVAFLMSQWFDEITYDKAKR